MRAGKARETALGHKRERLCRYIASPAVAIPGTDNQREQVNFPNGYRFFLKFFRALPLKAVVEGVISQLHFNVSR